ncbi:MAG: hypothetical protein QXN76_02020, partial [Nanopusillaceae archaeon]
ASMLLLSDLIKLPYDVIKQLYLALSTVFRPDVAGSILVGATEGLAELFEKFYNNVISNFEVKIEEKAEQPIKLEEKIEKTEENFEKNKKNRR